MSQTLERKNTELSFTTRVAIGNVCSKVNQEYNFIGSGLFSQVYGSSTTSD